MAHPAFIKAGQNSGLGIWRIENFQPVPIPTKDYGMFFSGDSYIVLKTTNEKKWHIHYWLGKATTKDESGTAAILAINMDEHVFKGAAIQYREVEGHETSTFLSYFQPAIRYIEGGHASGFFHVETNAGVDKRFYQVKGSKTVRLREVDPLISSMNKGDCFILDVDQNIYVFVGERAKNVEKLKAISVANQIRDQDHNGRGTVIILDQYSSEVEFEKFFKTLGSGSKEEVADEETGGDDEDFEVTINQEVTLCEVSDFTGELQITQIPPPFIQQQLSPLECYILDTGSSGIYVWIGKQSTPREKVEAMNTANRYLVASHHPHWVNITKIPQDTEPAIFKNYFLNWK